MPHLHMWQSMSALVTVICHSFHTHMIFSEPPIHPPALSLSTNTDVFVDIYLSIALRRRRRLWNVSSDEKREREREERCTTAWD